MEELVSSITRLADKLLYGQVSCSELCNAVKMQLSASGKLQHTPFSAMNRRLELAMTALARAATMAFLHEGGTPKQSDALLSPALYLIGRNIASGRFGVRFFDGIGQNRN